MGLTEEKNRREFNYEKRYLSWIKLNKDNFNITEFGFKEGKYRLKFEDKPENEGKFIWLHDMDTMFDKYPAHNGDFTEQRIY